MPQLDPLFVLTVAGTGVTLATIIWGLTQKTTFEDEQGNKRLKPAGHVAIGLAALSFLVAVLSQGLKQIAAEEKAQTAFEQRRAEAAERSEAELHRQFEIARAIQEDQDQVARDQKAVATAQNARAERELIRRSQIEQRLENIRIADIERDRDLKLARNVGKSNQQRLKENQVLLSQIARSMRVIRTIDGFVQWEIPVDGPLPRFSNGRSCERSPRGFVVDRAMIRDLTSLQNYPALNIFKLGRSVTYTFVASSNSSAQLFQNGFTGDLGWGMLGAPPDKVFYDCTRKVVKFAATLRPVDPPERTDRILAVQDLEDADLYIIVSRLNGREIDPSFDWNLWFRPIHINLKFDGTEYQPKASVGFQSLPNNLGLGDSFRVYKTTLNMN